ncbi:integrase catalytic domain-containing protein [Trichonephila clavipes]|nr:integrase catalytic domain-containing protein [Trichonephila clavipes]
MLALNSAIHEATYTSPSFLEHGRDIRLSYTYEKNSDTPQNKYEYVEKLLPSLEHIFNKVLKNLKDQEASHVELSTRATKQHHYDYKIGSLCFIKTPNIKSNLSPKLRPKFEGPYRVIERFSNVNYRVQHVEQLRKRFNTHVNRMIPFIKRFSYLHLKNLDDLQPDETEVKGIVPSPRYNLRARAGNPYVYVETPLHPEKLTVWCALWAGGIIGPYFFKNDEGHNVTVNGDRYRAMITNFFIPELNNHDVQELWFQQDGATCHTARATIDQFIERHSLVYADKPQTLDHLEDNIRRVIADIQPQMLKKVIENWTSRSDYIRASRGSHMPEIIFKIERKIHPACKKCCNHPASPDRILCCIGLSEFNPLIVMDFLCNESFVDISSRGRVPDWKCILMWMDAFRATVNVYKERKEPPKTIMTPQNVERVHVSILTCV